MRRLREFLLDVREVLRHLNGYYNPQYKPSQITEDPDTLGYRVDQGQESRGKTLHASSIDWSEFDEWRYEIEQDNR